MDSFGKLSTFIICSALALSCSKSKAKDPRPNNELGQVPFAAGAYPVVPLDGSPLPIVTAVPIQAQQAQDFFYRILPNEPGTILLIAEKIVHGDCQRGFLQTNQAILTIEDSGAVSHLRYWGVDQPVKLHDQPYLLRVTFFSQRDCFGAQGRHQLRLFPAPKGEGDPDPLPDDQPHPTPEPTPGPTPSPTTSPLPDTGGDEGEPDSGDNGGEGDGEDDNNDNGDGGESQEPDPEGDLATLTFWQPDAEGCQPLYKWSIAEILAKYQFSDAGPIDWVVEIAPVANKFLVKLKISDGPVDEQNILYNIIWVQVPTQAAAQKLRTKLLSKAAVHLFSDSACQHTDRILATGIDDIFAF